MNYSDNEMKILVLKSFQSRIASYLQIIINKKYYREENKKNYLKRLLGNINTISSQIHDDLLEMQDDDSLFLSIITSIDSLLESVTKSSELIKKDVTEHVKVIVQEEFIEEGEYKHSQREIFIPKTYNMEKLSGRERREFIQQNKMYGDYQIEISNIWEELSKMSNSIDSDVIRTIENGFIGKNINNEIEIEIPPIWILPTSTFPIECTLQILNDGLEKGLTKDEIFLNKLMVSSRIEETLNSWTEKNNSYVKKRIHILNEAITAHLERKYHLSVSTLMPQIEGLLKDAVKEAEIKEVNLDSLKEGCIKNAADKLAIKWKEQNKIMGNFVDLLNNENFPKVIAYLYKQEIDEENQLNRHGICHGIQTNFGTATSSLRLILIIDRIIFFMADDKNDK